MLISSALSARARKGAALIEYGMLVGLVAVVAIGSVGALGAKVDDTFSTISSELSSTRAQPVDVADADPASSLPAGVVAAGVVGQWTVHSERASGGSYQGYRTLGDGSYFHGTVSDVSFAVEGMQDVRQTYTQDYSSAHIFKLYFVTDGPLDLSHLAVDCGVIALALADGDRTTGTGYTAYRFDRATDAVLFEDGETYNCQLVES